MWPSGLLLGSLSLYLSLQDFALLAHVILHFLFIVVFCVWAPPQGAAVIQSVLAVSVESRHLVAHPYPASVLPLQFDYVEPLAADKSLT
jgi:hypothetical protein